MKSFTRGLAAGASLAALTALAPRAVANPAAEQATAGTPTPATDARSAAAPSESIPRLEPRVGAFSTTAFGLSGSGFVNELAGARLDLAYTPSFTLGLSLAYANLKGKDGRAHNVLPEVTLGYRLALGRVVGIPFHLGGGYLPKNGPTLRLGAGFDFLLGERSRLELTLLEPMVWVAKDRPEVSLDLGLGFSVAL